MSSMDGESRAPAPASQKEGEQAAVLSLPDEDSRPVRSGDIVSREVAGETILVPIKSKANELDNIFTLNEVATHVWNLIDGEKTIAGIAAGIVAEFDVEPAESLADTRELVAKFIEAGVVTIEP